jgi:hypothetical protein
MICLVEPGLTGFHKDASAEDERSSSKDSTLEMCDASRGHDGPERYRSSDAADRNVVAIGAADTIDRAQGADAVHHQ